MNTTTTWHVMTAADVVAMTFDTASAAKAYCLESKQRLPGLWVREVTTTVTYRTAYRPRMSVAA